MILPFNFSINFSLNFWFFIIWRDIRCTYISKIIGFSILQHLFLLKICAGQIIWTNLFFNIFRFLIGISRHLYLSYPKSDLIFEFQVFELYWIYYFSLLLEKLQILKAIVLFCLSHVGDFKMVGFISYTHFL